MALPKLIWLDETDLALAEGKLATIKSKLLPDWDWIKWNDENKDPMDSYLDLSAEIQTGSLMYPGKAIYAFGLPKCHQKIADDLNKIPENIIFILIAKPNKTFSFYKKAVALQEKGLAKIEEVKELTKKDAIEWVMKRATYLKAEIDQNASKILLDFVGLNINKLTMELKKLKNLTPDGIIPPWAVMQGCFSDGDADVRDLTVAIMKNDSVLAHELMHRLLVRGEHPLKICGFLTDWTRKLVIAGSCRGEYEKIKPELEKLQKLGEDKKPIKMFSNVGALYYSCNDYKESGRKYIWALNAVKQLLNVQLHLRRKTMDDFRIMHLYICKLMEESTSTKLSEDFEEKES